MKNGCFYTLSVLSHQVCPKIWKIGPNMKENMFANISPYICCVRFSPLMCQNWLFFDPEMRKTAYFANVGLRSPHMAPNYHKWALRCRKTHFLTFLLICFIKVLTPNPILTRRGTEDRPPEVFIARIFSYLR